MKLPPIPNDESTRLDTLRSLNILDTSPEERFDRLTRLAKRLFGVPIALVSLVDAERQWFKSRQGLNARETSRDISFCGHAIHGNDIFMVEDTLLDERFHDNPLVTEDPNIRFYAGFPLAVANGNKLGTLCLIDRKPRTLSDEDRDLLHDLSRMAEQELAAVQLATMDELTLLSNRRGFLALAQHVLNSCVRHKKPASLLYLDLDYFKAVNDQYGHAEGDFVLTTFSRLLKATCREADVMGRLGGDEFVVLLSNTDERGSKVLLKRLISATNEYNRQASRGYDIRFSAGVMQFDPVRHDTIDPLLAEADALMYERKRMRTAHK